MDKIYIQMYSFCGENIMEYDTKENLKKAADMGYCGVELFGAYLQMDPKEVKADLEALGLHAISMHAPEPGKVVELIPYAVEVGVKYMGIGMHCMSTAEDAHKFAALLNELGEKCYASGLTMIYHNHTHEFIQVEDKMIEDILMEETNPLYVNFELDAGWCAAAGVDPIELIRKYEGRFKLVHLKECDDVIGPQVPISFNDVPKDENGAPIFSEEQKAAMAYQKQMNCRAGNGIVNWTELKAAADAQGCEAYIVERERTYGGTRDDCLREDIAYYKTC